MASPPAKGTARADATFQDPVPEHFVYATFDAFEQIGYSLGVVLSVSRAKLKFVKGGKRYMHGHVEDRWFKMYSFNLDRAIRGIGVDGMNKRERMCFIIKKIQQDVTEWKRTTTDDDVELDDLELLKSRIQDDDDQAAPGSSSVHKGRRLEAVDVDSDGPGRKADGSVRLPTAEEKEEIDRMGTWHDKERAIDRIEDNIHGTRSNLAEVEVCIGEESGIMDCAMEMVQMQLDKLGMKPPTKSVQVQTLGRRVNTGARWVSVALEESLKKPVEGKKKKKRWEICGFWAELFSSLPKGMKARPTPVRMIVKTIRDIYMDKLLADAVDDRESNARQTLQEFTYDYFLNMYGLRNLSIHHMEQLAFGLRENKTNPACAMFSRLLGFYDPIDREGMDFYMEVLSALVQKSKSLAPKSLLNGDYGMYATSQLVTQVTTMLFRDKPRDGMRELLEKVAGLEEPYQIDLGNANINVDRLTDLLYKESESDKKMMVELFKVLFTEMDANKDGKLTCDEFSALIRLVDPNRSERDIVRIYAEVLDIANAQIMNADVFANVASKYLKSVCPIADSGVAGSPPPSSRTGVAPLIVETATVDEEDTSPSSPNAVTAFKKAAPLLRRLSQVYSTRDFEAIDPNAAPP